MPIIENWTDDPAEATTKHIIPAKGELAVSEATLHRISNEPYIARRMRAGELTVRADDPEPETPQITREFIAKAKRAELLEVIVANSDYTESDMEGITVEDREDDGETVDGLRTIAVRIVFGGE